MSLASELIEGSQDIKTVLIMKKELFESIAGVLDKQDEINCINCEIIIVKLSYMCLVPSLAE